MVRGVAGAGGWQNGSKGWLQARLQDRNCRQAVSEESKVSTGACVNSEPSANTPHSKRGHLQRNKVACSIRVKGSRQVESPTLTPAFSGDLEDEVSKSIWEVLVWHLEGGEEKCKPA